MFERLRELLGERADLFARNIAETDDRRWAAASLLVVAARMDEVFDPRERKAISDLLRVRFGLTEAETRELMAAAESGVERSQQIFHLTRIVEESFTPAERIDYAWRLATGRLPNPTEKALAAKYLSANPANPNDPARTKEFALAIFNLNAFLYVN